MDMLTIINIIVGVMSIVVGIYNKCTRQNHQKENRSLKVQKMIDGLMCVFPETIPIFSNEKTIMSKLKKLYWQFFGKLDYFLALNLDNIELSYIEDEKGKSILDINGHNQSITKKERKMLKKAKKTYIVDSAGQRYEIPCNFYL